MNNICKRIMLLTSSLIVFSVSLVSIYGATSSLDTNGWKLSGTLTSSYISASVTSTSTSVNTTYSTASISGIEYRSTAGKNVKSSKSVSGTAYVSYSLPSDGHYFIQATISGKLTTGAKKSFVITQ